MKKSKSIAEALFGAPVSYEEAMNLAMGRELCLDSYHVSAYREYREKKRIDGYNEEYKKAQALDRSLHQHHICEYRKNRAATLLEPTADYKERRDEIVAKHKENRAKYRTYGTPIRNKTDGYTVRDAGTIEQMAELDHMMRTATLPEPTVDYKERYEKMAAKYKENDVKYGSWPPHKAEHKLAKGMEKYVRDPEDGQVMQHDATHTSHTPGIFGRPLRGEKGGYVVHHVCSIEDQAEMRRRMAARELVVDPPSLLNKAPNEVVDKLKQVQDRSLERSRNEAGKHSQHVLKYAAEYDLRDWIQFLKDTHDRK